MTISPLAPQNILELPVVRGARFGAVEAGIKYKNRLDLMLMLLDPGSVLAGVFTRSSTRSAPVLHCQDILGREGENGIAVIANSGNSNAFTGRAGEAAMGECLDALSHKIQLPKTSIHMASTGVIGVPLKSSPITSAMDNLVANLAPQNANLAARAIMTTDTFPKTAAATVELDTIVTISGFAKGSGMIAPDMATMLGFLVTDVKISQALLQKALGITTEKSFNAITVDSDTSTSDSVYLGATGKADMTPIETEDDPRFAKFVQALQTVMTNLAHQIIRDGEGATKFVEIEVTGAVDDNSAKIIAMAVANSPLMKTAVAGEDPNWGRMVAAIGKSGQPADRDKLSFWIADQLVAEYGQGRADYSEETAALHMKGENVKFRIDLGLGAGAFTVWTCDLTKRYIEINADYRS